MARKIGSICAAGEKFTDNQGIEKTRWIRCGVLLETDKGFRIKMDAMPVVSDGWFAVFEDDQQEQRPATRPAPSRPAPEPMSGFDDSDLPF